MLPLLRRVRDDEPPSSEADVDDDMFDYVNNRLNSCYKEQREGTREANRNMIGDLLNYTEVANKKRRCKERTWLGSDHIDNKKRREYCGWALPFFISLFRWFHTF